MKEKQVSAGLIILNEQDEILMGHATGQTFYDLPKGRIDPTDATPEAAMLRECMEEFSYTPSSYIELGEYYYNREKNLHLFMETVQKNSIDMAGIKCLSSFEDSWTGKAIPEMDGFAWIPVSELDTHCSKSMSTLLTRIFRTKFKPKEK
jgi:putative (di)nucleoside polyphosphate hydrolase